MQKQKKQMIFLLVLLVALVGGYFGLKAYNSHVAAKEAKQEEENRILALDIDPADIQSIAYDYEETSYLFTREGYGWIYPEDTSVSIRKTAIETMAEKAASIIAVEKIEGVTNLEEYGLTEPAQIIEIITENHTYTIAVGDYNETIGKYYIYVDDTSVVYTIESGLVNSFSKNLENVKQEDITE